MGKGKVLLIDDNEIVLRAIEKLLIKEGYELTVIDDGKKALEVIKNISFNLIITDLRMPDFDGIQTIEKIRQIQAESKSSLSKFMIITAYPDADVFDKVSRLNIYRFMIKPFDKDIFLDAIEKCLDVKEGMRGEKSDFWETFGNKKIIDDFIAKQTEYNKRLIIQKGLPILGWNNTYVPEEIIIAAGFIPYRVMGASIPISLSKTYLSGNLCSNVQSVLECGLNGDYNFLDGIIIGGSTDVTKRLYDAWVRYANVPFGHLFDIPKRFDENAIIHYRESICFLIEEIEKYFKTKISGLNIAEAVSICNKSRKLLTGLNALRKTANPPVTPQQFLEICKLAMTGDKNSFNISLANLLDKIKPEAGEKEGFRILLTGSFQDQPWLLDVIESCGGIVVCEDLCTRYRYFSGLAREGSDPISAIAERYIKFKAPSATFVSQDERAEYLLDLIKEFKIGGVIYHILKFDDPYLFEFPDIKETLSGCGIPVLRIETEHNTTAVGQIMTRIQAFMETLKSGNPRRETAGCNK